MKPNVCFPLIGIFLVLGISSPARSAPSSRPTSRASVETRSQEIFKRILHKARKHSWKSLPLGSLVGRIGEQFLNVPYKGGTLETSDGVERCIVNLVALDCVTFFENSLAIARIIKKGKSRWADLIKEVTYLRYRKGKRNGYTSRLHYMAEWNQDNQAKKVIQPITQSLGGVSYNKTISFMSKHAKAYRALRNNPKLVTAIARIERHISQKPLFSVPLAKLQGIESKLRTGDIVLLASVTPSLDYGHTGLIVVDKKGRALFMHASPAQKKVVLDKPLHQAITAYKRVIGVTVLRPLEPTSQR
ncbi:MAG: DUF1460 domain-containing protein [Deltaproteobacteria bacterium]|nr:MAG: DUF1460 domain-containing protein [Deltaproteobacteria bacterium]